MQRGAEGSLQCCRRMLGARLQTCISHNVLQAVQQCSSTQTQPSCHCKAAAAQNTVYVLVNVRAAQGCPSGHKGRTQLQVWTPWQPQSRQAGL